MRGTGNDKQPWCGEINWSGVCVTKVNRNVGPLVRRGTNQHPFRENLQSKKTKHKNTGTAHSRIATQGNTQVLLFVPSPPVLNRTQPYSTVLDRAQRHFGLVCPSLAK